jgi:hypothetical protein
LLLAFKTFVNRIPPPGYVKFPDDPPPVGFMAITPGPSVHRSPALSSNIAEDDIRLYQKKYVGNIDDFLKFAEVDHDSSLKESLSKAHFDSWSSLKPSPALTLDVLEKVGVSIGHANHLFNSTARYEKVLRAKLAALDAQES